MVQPERIHKIIARAGVASRREAEKLITAGQVTVDGKKAVLGQKIDPDISVVKVKGQRIGKPETIVTYLFHKPENVVTTMSDPENRICLADYIANLKPRVYPVGRLDRDASGLLILTNDGQLAQRLMHPSHKVEKTYIVDVTGKVDSRALKKLEKGVMIENQMTAPARANLVDRNGKEAIIALTIREGRYHQVKRMCQEVGLIVRKLKRVSIGPIILGELKPGRYRKLSSRELKKLKESLRKY